VLARILPGLPRPLLARLALADGVADLPLPLPHAPLPLVAKAEAGDVDLRQGDGDHVLPLAADHLSVGDVLLEVLLDLPAHDVAEAAVVGIDAQGHQSTTSVKRPLAGS
jgi:hypothetical protein